MQELVSIVMPLYNTERYVGEAIESIQAQTYKHWELFVVDDGSTDNGAEVVKRYAEKDDRIFLFSQHNQGAAVARNVGITKANGRYLAFLDADDTWDNDFLQRQLDFMAEKNCALVYGAYRRIGADGKELLRPFIPPKQVDYQCLLRTCPIATNTVLYDTKTYGKFFMRTEFRSIREDYIYWLDMLKVIKVAYGNEHILATYRMLNTSVSRNKLHLIRPQWQVYYEVEKLGLAKSLFYVLCWAVNGIFKYIR